MNETLKSNDNSILVSQQKGLARNKTLYENIENANSQDRMDTELTMHLMGVYQSFDTSVFRDKIDKRAIENNSTQIDRIYEQMDLSELKKNVHKVKKKNFKIV